VKSKIFWPVILILVFALSRWPGLMPRNFSAAYALCFCAGLYLPRRLAWILPFGVMALTDLFLTFGYYHPADYSMLAFLRDQGPVYAAYAVLIGLGCVLSKKRSFLTLLSGGILGAILFSIVFYLISNTVCWLTMPYAKTLAGWIQALTTGNPAYPPTWTFFRNTLLSGGLFSGLFVGAMKTVEAVEEAPVEEEEEPEAEGEKAEPALAPAADDTGDAASS
jgi:hypothetical protein